MGVPLTDCHLMDAVNTVKVLNPAQGFLSSDWVDFLVTHAMNLVKLALKMYPG